MKGSEFHKEMETGEVQGRNISRKGGHALALAHELVSLSWQIHATNEAPKFSLNHIADTSIYVRS